MLLEEQCSYMFHSGIRCPSQARWRVFFSQDHPFDFIDLCKDHLKEIKVYAERLDLKEKVVYKYEQKNKDFSHS